VSEREVYHSCLPALSLGVVLICPFLLPHSLDRNSIGDKGAAAFGEALKRKKKEGGREKFYKSKP
jgi:hypothetical protein